MFAFERRPQLAAADDGRRRRPIVDPTPSHMVAPRLRQAVTPPSRRLALPVDGLQLGIPLSVAPPTVRRVLAGQAQPLEPDLRERLETGFGQQLDEVRIHQDGDAATSARALRANAFAAGPHIVFGRGQYAPATEVGRRLLAHEVAHVLDQRSAPGSPVIQRDAAPEQQDWLPELKQILPKTPGLVGDIDRVAMLLDIFGSAQLEQHVRAINGDPDAKKFTLANGVPGVVALFDTRKGAELDVAAAERALKEHPNLYKRSTLERATRQVPVEAPRSFWFESPDKQKLPSPKENEPPPTSSEERKVVFVEPDLSSTASGLFVSFAYPSPDVGTDRIRIAKNQILTAFARVQRDLASLPPAADVAERREQQRVRARLSEPLSMFTRRNPLKVYIATDPQSEMATGQIAATTDRVFVRLADVGKEDRLQAAIRVPLILLRGGMLPTPGGIQDVPAASEADLQRIVLHESLHAMLIRLSSDAESVWQSKKKGLTVKGSAYPAARFAEMVRKFLIAHEEVFAYENEATLYPPVSANKGAYDLFIKNVRSFLERRGLKLTALPRAIPVATLVGGKAVSWTVTYQVPAGTIDLTLGDQEVIDFLLPMYPLG